MRPQSGFYQQQVLLQLLQQQQQQQQVVQADNVLGIAAAAAAPAAMSVGLPAFKHYWQQLVDLGQMPLTGGALGFFVWEFGLPLPAGPDGSVNFKCQLMGSHKDAIADAEELERAGVIWWEELISLLPNLSPEQIVLGEATYKDGWDPPPNEELPLLPPGHQYQALSGTVVVTLPAASQQPHAQPSRFLPSNNKGFADSQHLDAALLRVTVKATDVTACHPQKPDPEVRQHVRTKLQEKVQTKLPSTTAAMLKWQLQWQLRSQHRQLLEQGAFGRLVVAPAAADALPCAPSLGMRSKLMLAGA
jgi:hypothetical protein